MPISIRLASAFQRERWAKAATSKSAPSSRLARASRFSEKAAVTLEVMDAKGKQVAKLAASGEPGVRRAVWDLKRAAGKTQVPVEAGEYVVRLTSGGKTLERKLRVKGP